MEWPLWRRRTDFIAARASDISINEHQLLQALLGMPYPAQRWQLLIWADFNGSGWMVMPTISELPAREYTDFHDVCQEAIPEYTIETGSALVKEWAQQ